MSRTDFIISCPYCRRQYQMKLDRDEVTRKKTRATCGRCGNTFEVASRIAVPGAAAMAPPAATTARRPPPPPAPSTKRPTIPPPAPPAPRSAQSQELARIATEITEAADVVARSAAPQSPLTEDPYAQYQETEATSEPVDEFGTAATQVVPRELVAKVAAASIADATHAVPDAIPTPPATIVPPPVAAQDDTRDWITRSDPGLHGFSRVPSPTLAALAVLLR